jgi:hypothetical protein
MYGFLYIMDSKQKWQKRFVEVKDSAVYHYKDSKVRNTDEFAHSSLIERINREMENNSYAT